MTKPINIPDLIHRLHTRANIRRSIPHRKSVQENQPDRIADILDEAGTALTLLYEEQSTEECITRIMAAIRPTLHGMVDPRSHDNFEQWVDGCCRQAAKDIVETAGVDN